MNELRWILFAAGIGVIAVIWLLSSRKHTGDDPPELTDSVEPVVPPGDGDGELVVLHVASDVELDGQALLGALERAGLQFGRMDVYHQLEDGREVFSVANMLEPGTFGAASTPGVALFATLTGAGDGQGIFGRMLACARALADELDAEVLDGERHLLTDEAEARIRGEIAAFEAQARGG